MNNNDGNLCLGHGQGVSFHHAVSGEVLVVGLRNRLVLFDFAISAQLTFINIMFDHD